MHIFYVCFGLKSTLFLRNHACWWLHHAYYSVLTCFVCYYLARRVLPPSKLILFACRAISPGFAFCWGKWLIGGSFVASCPRIVAARTSFASSCPSALFPLFFCAYSWACQPGATSRPKRLFKSANGYFYGCRKSQAIAWFRSTGIPAPWTLTVHRRLF